MLLKRLYNHDAPQDDWGRRQDRCQACGGKGVVINETNDGVVPCPAGCEGGMVTRLVPPLRAVEFLHGGRRQNFSPGLVAAALTEGWMTLEAGTITLRVLPRDVVYRIEHMPGRYCCHCNAKLPDDIAGELARVHVASEHRGVPSPHVHHPAGYGMTNAYECVREG